MILLDTHAWVWFASTPKKLSRSANDRIEEAIQQRTPILISCVSTWEVALLVARGRLKLSMDVESWVRHSESTPFFDFVPVDNAIAVHAVGLPPSLHPDPADRIIVATALNRGATLVTKDKRITRSKLVRCFW